MTSRTPIDDSEQLYFEMLDAWYEHGDTARARRVAKRIDAMLEERPDVRASIRGDELRSLVAEVKNDLLTAIRYRESEIRKIFELHSMSINKPGWDYVVKRYGYSDLGDRLDILAALYADDGDLDRAAEILEESRAFCHGHGIPFDGQDVVDEVAHARKVRASSKRGRRAKSA